MATTQASDPSAKGMLLDYFRRYLRLEALKVNDRHDFGVVIKETIEPCDHRRWWQRALDWVWGLWGSQLYGLEWAILVHVGLKCPKCNMGGVRVYSDFLLVTSEVSQLMAEDVRQMASEFPEECVCRSMD